MRCRTSNALAWVSAATLKRLAIPRPQNYVILKRRDKLMNTGQNRIFDELAKLMTDAAGAAQGVRREVESAFRAQAERMISSMDLVQREEFEAVREMAVKARAENEKLAARIAELEAKPAAKASKPAASAAKSRSAAKK